MSASATMCFTTQHLQYMWLDETTRGQQVSIHGFSDETAPCGTKVLMEWFLRKGKDAHWQYLPNARTEATVDEQRSVVMLVYFNATKRTMQETTRPFPIVWVHIDDWEPGVARPERSSYQLACTVCTITPTLGYEGDRAGVVTCIDDCSNSATDIYVAADHVGVATGDTKLIARFTVKLFASWNEMVWKEARAIFRLFGPSREFVDTARVREQLAKRWAILMRYKPPELRSIDDVQLNTLIGSCTTERQVPAVIAESEFCGSRDGTRTSIYRSFQCLVEFVGRSHLIGEIFRRRRIWLGSTHVLPRFIQPKDEEDRYLVRIDHRCTCDAPMLNVEILTSQTRYRSAVSRMRVSVGALCKAKGDLQALIYEFKRRTTSANLHVVGGLLLGDIYPLERDVQCSYADAAAKELDTWWYAIGSIDKRDRLDVRSAVTNW